MEFRAFELLPPGLLERLDALLAAGEPEAVVETFCRAVLHMTDEQVHGGTDLGTGINVPHRGFGGRDHSGGQRPIGDAGQLAASCA